MPLTLQCACESAPPEFLANCEAYASYFHVETVYWWNGYYNLIGSVDLRVKDHPEINPLRVDSIADEITPRHAGPRRTYDLLIPEEMLNYWALFQVSLGGGQSLSQIVPKFPATVWQVIWSIRTLFHCINGETNYGDREITSWNYIPDDNSCSTTMAPIAVTTIITKGAGNIELFASAPLAGCGDVRAFGERFQPNPFAINYSLVQPNPGVIFCVCASGGTPPYRYKVINGVLPCGIFLQPDGCFSAVPDDGCEITGDLTIEVTDSLNATAEAVCAFMPKDERPCDDQTQLNWLL